MRPLDPAAPRASAGPASKTAGRLALLGLVAAAWLWIGIHSASRASAFRDALRHIQSQQSQLERWRRSYQPEVGRSTLGPADSNAAAPAPSTDKLVLAERVTRFAEAFGLTSVQVNFLPRADSVGRASVGKATLLGSPLAPYALTVDCAGSFAAMVQFVSHLSPGFAIANIDAARTPTETRYRVVLSVYEAAHGSGSD